MWLLLVIESLCASQMGAELDNKTGLQKVVQVVSPLVPLD